MSAGSGAAGRVSRERRRALLRVAANRGAKYPYDLRPGLSCTLGAAQARVRGRVPSYPPPEGSAPGSNRPQWFGGAYTPAGTGEGVGAAVGGAAAAAALVGPDSFFPYVRARGGTRLVSTGS